MAYLKIDIIVPELEALMATVQEVQADFKTFRGEVKSKLDAIDDVMEGMGTTIEQLRNQVEAGQVDQATVDQLASDLTEARSQVAAVNPADPSGDDTTT